MEKIFLACIWVTFTAIKVLKEENVVNLVNKEQLLLQGLAANNTKAIETIYKHNFSMVQSLVLNNSGSYDDARDIFQEAMIILYEKSRSKDFQLSCQIRTFIYSICKKLWLKRLQQQGRYRNGDITMMEETVAVEDDLENAKQRDANFEKMESAMEKLGDPCKSLLKAYYIEKKNMNEIAKAFGYTNTDNAKTQKYKCLMRLKKLFFAQQDKTKEDE